MYLGTLKFFEKEAEGGLAALHQQLAGEPELLAFIQQPFLPSGWYDVLPVVGLIKAEARVFGLTVRQYLVRRSVFQFHVDIHGVYRVLLKLLSPEAVGMRLPRLLTQIFDHGASDVKKMEPGWIESVLSGFPRLLWEWYSTAFEIYTQTALAMAGAKQVTALVRDPESDGERDGVELIKFRVDARWLP